MTLDEYLKRRDNYVEFADTVCSMLSAAIAEQQDLKSPALTNARAKTEKSLRDKLIDRNLVASTTVQDEIKDLAGCRLVFYTSDDVEAFLHSRIIFENFAVDTNATRIHHPVPGEANEDVHYRAIHYLVTLPEAKLGDPQYARFRGIRCEVQIQSLLSHAWAETAHDVTYKRPLQPGYGQRQKDKLNERMTSIMTQYLVPAALELQKVKSDARLLERGNDLLARNVIKLLQENTDNNQRTELLEGIRQAVIPFHDELPRFYGELRPLLAAVIHAGRTTEPIPIETPVGNFTGRTPDDVTEAAVDILSCLRYLDVRATFAIYCEVFPGALDERERQRILHAVDHLAEHNVAVWQQAGCYVQSELLSELSGFDAAQRRLLRPLVLSVCRKALEPEITGTSSPSFDTVSFHTGSVRVDDTLTAVRAQALGILETLFVESKSDAEQRAIFDAMLAATRHPYSTKYGDELIQVTLENSCRIVEFCVGHYASMPYELWQHVEHSFLWLYQHAPSWPEESQFQLHAKAEQLVVSITRFRDLINADQDFIRHKTLVGFEPVFPHDWEADVPDFQRTAAYRDAQIEEYVAQIMPETSEEWLRLIRRCAATQSNDGATFPIFYKFLQRLSELKPAIIRQYLREAADELEDFLTGILPGLECAEPADTEALMAQWIADGLYLAAIGRHLRLSKNSHPDLIRALVLRAIEMKNAAAVIEAAAICVARRESIGSPLVADVFIPAITYLTECKNTRWIDQCWFQPAARKFFASLDLAQAQTILTNLLELPNIDHHAEVILAEIARSHYDAVWHFFGDRIPRDAPGPDGNYEAIPHQFFHVAEALAAEPARALAIVRTWYVDDDPMFEFRGGRLVAIAFATFSDAFRDGLLSLIESEGEAVFDFAHSILANYEGQLAIHSVCQALVESLPDDDKRLNHVKILLMGTGVVSGAFGFVEAYQRKKAEVASWSADPRPKVRAFAVRYVRGLDRDIAREQATAEQRHGLRSLEWEHRAAE